MRGCQSYVDHVLQESLVVLLHVLSVSPPVDLLVLPPGRRLGLSGSGIVAASSASLSVVVAVSVVHLHLDPDDDGGDVDLKGPGETE